MTASLGSHPASAPGHSPGEYGEELLRGLARPVPQSHAWGLVKTGVVGALTFGVWPLLAWPGNVSNVLTEEAKQVRQVAEWARLRGALPVAAATLRSAAERTAPPPVLSLLPVLLALGVAGVLVAHLLAADGGLVAATYQSDADSIASLFGLWTIGLSAGYLLHWLQVQLHVANLRRFLTQFNRFAEAEGVPPVRLPGGVWGLNPFWIGGGVVLTLCGAWWGVPMMLAGAAHRRYATLTSRAVRAALASRVRQLLQVAHDSVRRCPTSRCRAPLPPAARFCPRCGTRAGVGSEGFSGFSGAGRYPRER